METSFDSHVEILENLTNLRSKLARIKLSACVFDHCFISNFIYGFIYLLGFVFLVLVVFQMQMRCFQLQMKSKSSGI